MTTTLDREAERRAHAALRTPAEISRRLGVPVGTLAQWRSTGRGPAFTKIGRVIRYSDNDIDDFIEANRVCPAAVPQAVSR